jgi:hypothetical protein
MLLFFGLIFYIMIFGGIGWFFRTLCFVYGNRERFVLGIFYALMSFIFGIVGLSLTLRFLSDS